jgi:hypothetical protein
MIFGLYLGYQESYTPSFRKILSHKEGYTTVFRFPVLQPISKTDGKCFVDAKITNPDPALGIPRLYRIFVTAQA